MAREEATQAAPRSARSRLSYKETRELAALPGEIEALEAEQRALGLTMSDADYHRRGAEQLKLDRQRLEALPALIETKLARWEALEARVLG